MTVDAAIEGLSRFAFCAAALGMVLAMAGAAEVWPSYGGPADADPSVHDGRLRPAVGVQCIAIFRADRLGKHDEDGLGYGFNHHPMIAHWGGRFWVEFQGAPSDGSLGPAPPVHAFIAHSADGRAWSRPRVVFPSVVMGGANTCLHQRMGFYVASNGRLLVLGFHGKHPSPNDGTGWVRVVREILGPDDYGPIYAIRYNAGHGQADTGIAHYSTSPDEGFKAACAELYEDKLFRQQWYEEDRDPAFYVITQEDMSSTGDAAKAFAWCTLPDGRKFGMWKGAWFALATAWEEGQVQLRQDSSAFREHRGAKLWGQRTPDGRYVMVYDLASEGRRYPLVAAVSEDGLAYSDRWVVIHGDIPPTRYANPPNVGGFADNKDGGPQYVRGICEGNGSPSADSFWLVYSLNKEDIWVAEVPVPVRCAVSSDVNDDFQAMTPGGRVTDWNIYSSGWCRVRVEEEGSNRFLRLRDSDPYDYAKAVRVFQESAVAAISFRVRAAQTDRGRLELDVLDASGRRPVRLVFDEAGRVLANVGSEMLQAGGYVAGTWQTVALTIDARAGAYDMSLNGSQVRTGAALAEAVSSVERIEFRTGQYRLDDLSRVWGWPNYGDTDLPGADTPVPEAVFDVDDVGLRRLSAPLQPLVLSIDHVSTGKAYARGTASVGSLPYIDRAYAIESLPAGLDGAEMLRTANDDDYVAASDHLRFTLSREARVHLAVKTDATSLPAWADGFVPEPGTIRAGLAGEFALYVKTFPAGQATLGGNDRTTTGASSCYFVVATESDSDGDGLPDGDETGVYGTDPSRADTDGDGMGDGLEVSRGFDPLDADQDGNGTPDGQDDWDSDGVPNASDLTPGTPPGPAGGGRTSSCCSRMPRSSLLACAVAGAPLLALARRRSSSRQRSSPHTLQFPK